MEVVAGPVGIRLPEPALRLPLIHPVGLPDPPDPKGDRSDDLDVQRVVGAGEHRGRGPTHQYHPSFRGKVGQDRKSTRLNSSHGYISYAVFCLKKKKKNKKKKTTITTITPTLYSAS